MRERSDCDAGIIDESWVNWEIKSWDAMMFKVAMKNTG